MQIIQFVFSVIIALCAVAMFVGAVITPSPIKVVSVTLLALICLFSLFLVKLAYCEMSTIKAYLDNMAAVDSLFAPVYQKPTKNIDNCITYILNQVKKSGCCGFSDDEIFGMALHYYQEDNIEVGSPLKCNVVVNHILCQD